MSGLIFSPRIFFAPEGMEFISHPFEPWAGTRVCVYVCVCMCVCLCVCLCVHTHAQLWLTIWLSCSAVSSGQSSSG